MAGRKVMKELFVVTPPTNQPPLPCHACHIPPSPMQYNCDYMVDYDDRVGNGRISVVIPFDWVLIRWRKPSLLAAEL